MPIVPPTSDSDLLNFANNMDTRLTAAPTIWGLVAADATAFHALATDFATRLAAATNPDTRGKVTIANKNVSKAALRAKASQLIRIISAYPPVTPGMRAQMLLNPRHTPATPVPPPGTAPLLKINSAGVLELMDETTPTRRGKPAGTIGALVFVKFALPDAPPPVTLDDTKFSIVATRGRVPLPLPADADAKKCYVLAQWFNERGAVGPISAMVSTTIAA